jgi:hypothetical protein
MFAALSLLGVGSVLVTTPQERKQHGKVVDKSQSALIEENQSMSIFQCTPRMFY